jgi:ATP-binding cassette subfamily B (MDR/TAP) protein 1
MNLSFSYPHVEAFAKARSAYKSIMTILQRKPRINVNGNGIKLDSRLGEIEFKDVHFTYPARPDVKVSE